MDTRKRNQTSWYYTSSTTILPCQNISSGFPNRRSDFQAHHVSSFSPECVRSIRKRDQTSWFYSSYTTFIPCQNISPGFPNSRSDCQAHVSNFSLDKKTRSDFIPQQSSPVGIFHHVSLIQAHVSSFSPMCFSRQENGIRSYGSTTVPQHSSPVQTFYQVSLIGEVVSSFSPTHFRWTSKLVQTSWYYSNLTTTLP